MSGQDRTHDKATGAPRGLSEAVIRERTGKGSADWYTLLDDWGAAEKGHPAIARHLREAFGISPWWAQMLTARYESARGLKEETLPLPAELAAAFARNAAARAGFGRLAPDEQQAAVAWVGDAMQRETRKRRAKQALEYLSAPGDRTPW